MKPWLIPVVLALSAVALAAQAQGPGRRYLPDAVPDLVSNLVPIGNYPPTNHLRLAIGLPVQNQDELTELLRQVYDPGSTNFHRYLTPAEYTRRFGPSEQQYDAVRQFAEANGLVVVGTFSNRVVLDVEGRVSDVERAFQVTERVYQHPTDARTFFAPDTTPSVPANLPVLSVSGLDNYSLPAPKHVLRPAALTPQSGSGPSGTYAGGDFRAAYLPGVALNGSGQSVALLEFDGYYATDIASYESSFSLPSVPLVNIAVDGGVSNVGSGNSEVALDIEMAVSMAPGLTQVLVYEAPNPSPWPDLLSRIANDNLAKQISCSWGGGSPDPTSEQLFQQMALQGQSFFNASGDSDAFTGSVPFPSDSTNITQVGGTTLATTGPGGAWSGETVWNWGQVKGKYVGSSGGVSTTYSIPAWQQGIDMTANLGSTTMRNIPDVALTADNIYVKYNNGSSGTFGGTSCAAPLWAAVTALINQQAAAAGQAPAGFLNPLVYSLGKSAVFTNNFRDITSGNNFSRSSPTNYPGVAGYDLCTGWGTPKGTNLINVLALKLYVAGQPANRTVPAGGNVTFSVTAGGLPPFGYRWQFNGANLANNTHVSGVNSNVLLLTAVTTNDSGSYQVIITNVAGAITSNPAQLTVATSANTNRPPVLSPIPDQTVYATGTLTLTNVATDPDGDALTFGFA
ncbi:MAG TPA: protease pro-enzyme activation domain-containing protein, partial [Verrucomicrobiae bacterium]|nr:protease pro-enzyme activation domain-containing protein [Verrucomicrobiae bacterium]